MSSRLLFVSNLFPDPREPIRGLDNQVLLHHLQRLEDFEVRVLSPRPALPGTSAWNAIATLRAKEEDQDFRPVYFPFPYVPRAGGLANDFLLRTAAARPLAKLTADFRPDVVLTSWLFPDGCAMASLCQRVGLLLVLITQGTDTHQYLNRPLRRAKILKAISRSAAVICRSGDLGRRLREAGAPPEKLRTIYNGVDQEIFARMDRAAARTALGIAPDDAVLLFVGNLLPVKNPGMLVAALQQLNQARALRGLRGAILNIIGSGPLEAQLRHRAETLGLSGSIHFLGRQPPTEVARHMNAADVFCLASWNEGFPNVILEAMACGLPVVSTDVGGIRERIDRPSRGHLVHAGDVDGFATALHSTLARGERVPVEESPDDLSWPASAAAYARVLREALGPATFDDGSDFRR